MPNWWRKAEDTQAEAVHAGAGSHEGESGMVFLEALKKRRSEGLIPVIPDIKCFSPKDGDLMRGRDPVEIAKTLEKAGACVLSVVTEEREFRGSMELLRAVCAAVRVPVLRKDFIETVRDLEETKEAGAAAILLMYSCLGKEKLEFLYREALQMGLLPFVETHTGEELSYAEQLGAPLIGINNRNILLLERDGGDVSHAAGLLTGLRDHLRGGDAAEDPACAEPFLVVESGLQCGADVRTAVRSGADAALVGTAILREEDPAAMYRAMSRPCDLKICGLMNREGAELCVRNHVDMLGFVTEYPADVPWNLQREETKALLESCRAAGKTEKSGGYAKTCIVTGGSTEKVLSLARELRPDAVQLHGRESLQETAETAQALKEEGILLIRSVPGTPALREEMFGTADLQQIAELLGRTETSAILLDSRDAGNAASGGGSILTADLSDTHTPVGRKAFCSGSGMRPEAGDGLLLVIGGGLTADNVREGIRRFAPDMVDVMTGVEDLPGIKSGEKLSRLVHSLEEKCGARGLIRSIIAV